MRSRFWKRLAGCIAIRTLLAAAPEYHVGVADAGTVRAVVLQDRHGNRALFAQSAAPITRPVADFVAVRFVRSLQVDRAAILLAGGAAEDLIAALETALSRLEPAALSFNGQLISVTANGQCRATLFPISFDGCTSGKAVRAPVRSAFQMIDLAQALQRRGETAPVWPVQAIALGGQVTILGIGGNPGAARYQAPRRIVVPMSNDSITPPPDSRIDSAIRQVLSRIGRSLHADAMMRLLVHFFLAAWAFAQTQPGDRNKPLPTFQDYKVADIYTGKPATPVLKTPEDRQFRTRIRRGASEGANFAGHYAVVLLGCGTQCSSFLIVDVQTGRVFARAQKEYTCEPYYNLDSRLLVSDVCTGAPTGTGCTRAFWEWTGTELRLLSRTPISCDAPGLPKGFRLPNAAGRRQ